MQIVARRPARDLIDAVLKNMRQNLEPLRYSTLAPSRYVVYLHPTEYARLESIVPILREQTGRALTEELETLNRGSVLRQYAAKLFGDRSPRIQRASTDWHIEFLADPDGDIAEGDILIDSELLLPTSPELGVGQRTRRITTMHAGGRTTTRAHIIGRAQDVPGDHAFARIEYSDDDGRHVHDIVKDSVTVGRGGNTSPVDIRIAASADVSREHARIRRDPVTGRFFLVDLSSLGTTLNTRHVPRGYDEVDGTKRENGAETPLPDRARIGLADTVYLEFHMVR